MCGVSLVLSILAMYMHNCSSANEASTAMSPWVILLLRRPKVYRLFCLINLLTILMKRARNVTFVLLLLLSLSLFAIVSYSVLLICYLAIRLLSRKCGIKLSVSVLQCKLCK